MFHSLLLEMVILTSTIFKSARTLKRTTWKTLTRHSFYVISTHLSFYRTGIYFQLFWKKCNEYPHETLFLNVRFTWYRNYYVRSIHITQNILTNISVLYLCLGNSIPHFLMFRTVWLNDVGIRYLPSFVYCSYTIAWFVRKIQYTFIIDWYSKVLHSQFTRLFWLYCCVWEWYCKL